MAAPPPFSGETYAEIIKCPKCLRQNSITLKTVNDNYVLSCLGYPDCKNSIWLPSSIIKEVTVTSDVCSRCGPGYKKLKFRLKSIRHISVLNQRNFAADDALTYTTCIACDSSFQELCDISQPQVKWTDGTTAAERNQSSMNARNVPRNNGGSATTDTRAPAARSINSVRLPEATTVRQPLVPVAASRPSRPGPNAMHPPPPPPANNSRNNSRIDPAARGSSPYAKCNKCGNNLKKSVQSFVQVKKSQEIDQSPFVSD